MNYLLLSLTFSLSLTSSYVNKYNKDSFEIEPMITNFVPYSPAAILDFKNKIILSSKNYVKEAKIRGIHRPDPLSKFKFSMKFNGTYEENYPIVFSGYCVEETKEIFLTPTFHEAIFFHELGHCDLGYSHLADNNVPTTGQSMLLMSWAFNTSHFHSNKKRILDHFFNDPHPRLNSYLGWEHHAVMLNQINYYHYNNNPAN